MNEFNNKDEQGREVFKTYCKRKRELTYLKGSKDEYAYWDVAYLSGTTAVIGEIKMREYESTAFNNWWLQKNKLDELREIKRKVDKKNGNTNSRIHYINLFTDDEIMVWDITDINIPSLVQSLQRTTYGDTSKINKDIIELPNYLAILRDCSWQTPIKDIKNPDEDSLPF